MRARLRRLWRWPPFRFALAAALLWWPWPACAALYGGDVKALARALMAASGAPVELAFELRNVGAAPSLDAWHLPLYLEDTETGAFVQTVLDLRRGGYIASAFFTALVLATPLRRARRKLGVLVGGLAALQVLPLLPLLSFLSGKLPVQVFHFGRFARWAIEIAYHALVAAPGMAYAVPALLWLLLIWVAEPACLRQPIQRFGLIRWNAAAQ